MKTEVIKKIPESSRTRIFLQKTHGVSRLAFFTAVFAALITVLSLFVFSKSNAAGYKNLYSDTYAYSLEEPDSVSVVGIGNSDLYSGFVPNVLWREYGFPSVVSGAPCDTAKNAYFRLADILSRQNPSVVLIEVDMVYQNGSFVSGISADDRIRNVLKSMTGEGIERFFKNTFSIFLFHDRWKNINGISETATENHGYVLSKDECEFDYSSDYMQEQSPETINPEDMEYLEKTVELCRNHDAIPVLIEMPSAASWNGARHAGIRAFAEENELLFIDLNSPESGYQPDFSRDFRDAGNHLNFYGAEKATLFIGKRLSSLGVLSDKRNSASYYSWNRYSDLFFLNMTEK